MRSTWATLAFIVVLAGTSPAAARPQHKKALADHFGPFLPRHLNDCITCHLPESPTAKDDSEKPHNPFGARLKAVRTELKKAEKDSDIVSRLKVVAGEDSDGDGVTNLIELLAGRNPGDKRDRPATGEIERAKKILTAFQSRKPYPWKPFEPVVRPEVPPSPGVGAWSNGVANPIDAFIAAEHELHGLTPRPEAPRHVLVRRVYLDLIGVPPTRDELQAALTDPSPEWYEKIVDRLLASPQHGERWARHWMDVWRYVDFGNSGLQDGWTGVPNMWRWRDWIVRSLNADKGYDRMVQEMLAADELCPDDLDSLAATCYLARNKGNNRDAWLHDSINHACRAFLGVTMECARCHAHPYDPIRQEEYYRLRAIFEPYSIRVEPMKDVPDPKKNGITRIYDQNLNPKTYFYIRGVEQNPDKERVITPGVPKLLGEAGFEVVPVTLPVGEGNKPRNSTGRRLALARWITSPGNPLAARVAVNHIWLRHFGTPLVSSVFDFGAGGLPPSHPALLDWLAAEFMDSSWSMQKLHRLIVTSSTYRMSSTPDSANLQIDPDNQFYWRMPSRRMEAEVVRDSLLHVAGLLDPAMGGPEIETKLGLQTFRRSIYFKFTQNDYLKEMESFDVPTPDDCYCRQYTIAPQQALMLLNSDLALVLARQLGRDLAVTAGSDPARFVRAAFERVLSRPPSPAEEEICLRYIAEQTRFLEENQKRLGNNPRGDANRGSTDPALRVRENLVHMLLNHHDFVTVR